MLRIGMLGAMRIASLVFAAACLPAFAADVEEGRKLVEEKKCEACHARKAPGGEAKQIYLRKDRRVTTLAKLKSQVALCNSELNLQLFPDDEEHVAEFLDRTYYRFSSSRSMTRY